MDSCNSCSCHVILTGIPILVPPEPCFHRKIRPQENWSYGAYIRRKVGIKKNTPLATLPAQTARNHIIFTTHEARIFATHHRKPHATFTRTNLPHHQRMHPDAQILVTSPATIAVDNDNLIFCHNNHKAMIGSTGGGVVGG